MDKLFKRWCIWGHTLHTHTSSYVHNGFYRALISMGHHCDWVADLPNNMLNIEPYTVFITEGQVDKYIPLRSDCFYVIHHSDKARYLAAGVPEAHILRMIIYDNKVKNIGETVLGKPWNKYITDDHPVETYLEWTHDKPGLNYGRTLHFPWATDLLPPEVQYNMDNLEHIAKKKKTGFYFVGFYAGTQQDYGRFLQQYGITYIPAGGFSDKNLSIEENMDRIQSSYFASAISQQNQVDRGYLPCRIFKNISYGAFGVTNNPAIGEFFKDYADEYSLIVDTDFKRLTEKALHRMMNRNFESERKLMAFIRDEHTYINRVQGIVGGFIHHWNYLKSKGEM